MRTGNIQYASSLSADGRLLAYVEFDPATGTDVWLLPLDLADPNRAEFKALGNMEAGPDNCYVPKTEVHYQLWNRLIGVTDPARTGETQAR